MPCEPSLLNQFIHRDRVKEMDLRPLFFDTNVYMGYALDDRFEDFHPQCCDLFGAPNSRHTSITVRDELDRKKHDRNRLYRELLDHLEGGKPIEEFQPSSSKKSDRNHWTRILSAYKEGSIDLEYLRLLGTELSQGIMDGLSKTNKELVRRSNDGQMKAHFEMIDIHRPDNSILADFFDWAIPGTGSCFITGDGNIHKKREEIFDYVRNWKNADCNHLSLYFIKEAPVRLCG